MSGSSVNRYMGAVVLGVFLYAGWMVARRTPDGESAVPNDPQATGRKAEFDRIYGGTDLRILQFYARDGSVVEGSSTVLCYGVVNARAVRIEPSVDGLGPSINRCVEVTPDRDTRYTLIAEGKDGRTVSESLSVTVTADREALPKIASFRAGARSFDYHGRLIVPLSFNAVNAEEVSIEPAVFPPLYGVPTGRFYVTPEKTTTYTLTARNKHGRKVHQRLTVEVPARPD